MHPLEKRTSIYTQQEIDEFQRLTVMPRAREQVVSVLTQGLCVAQGSCSTKEVVGSQQFDLSVLQQGVDEVEAAVTPGWWTTIEKIWTRIHVVGQLGGLITVGILITQICKFIWRLFKLCLLYTSPSPRDGLLSRMPSSA